MKCVPLFLCVALVPLVCLGHPIGGDDAIERLVSSHHGEVRHRGRGTYIIFSLDSFENHHSSESQEHRPQVPHVSTEETFYVYRPEPDHHHHSHEIVAHRHSSSSSSSSSSESHEHHHHNGFLDNPEDKIQAVNEVL